MIASEAIGAATRALIHLTQQIREEFEEAQGLRMTVGEASRFWGLDDETCEAVLARLVDSGFLARDQEGRYRQIVCAIQPSVQ